MEKFLIDLIGFAAAFIVTIASIPQALLLWQTKVIDGLSITYYKMLLTGVVLWLVYGICIVSWPLIVANIISICIIMFILYFIIDISRRTKGE